MLLVLVVGCRWYRWRVVGARVWLLLVFMAECCWCWWWGAAWVCVGGWAGVWEDPLPAKCVDPLPAKCVDPLSLIII